MGGFDNMQMAPLGSGPEMSKLAAIGPSGDVPTGGRQVGVRGSWAEFATQAGRSYYVNVVTGEKTWALPSDYNTGRSNLTGPTTPAGTPRGHSNLFVGSIPPGSNEVTLRQMFSPFGTIVSLKVSDNKTYGFVKFSHVTEAQQAIDATNGALIKGVPLVVRYANMDKH